MQKEYVIRTQSDYANKYSLGELVVEGVAFFREDRRNLTKEQIIAMQNVVRAQGGRIVAA